MTAESRGSPDGGDDVSKTNDNQLSKASRFHLLFVSTFNMKIHLNSISAGT